MGDDILEMIVCLRDGKGAAEQLKATRMYPEEAKNVALDISLRTTSPNWNLAEAGVSASIPEDAGPRLQNESLASD